MNFVLQPWQLLLFILAGWVNRQQQEVVEYLRTENQVLKETIGTRRILLNDDQRRRLAVQGKVLGRKTLAAVGGLQEKMETEDAALAISAVYPTGVHAENTSTTGASQEHSLSLILFLFVLR